MMRKIPRPYMIVVSCLASLLMITVGSLVALYNLTRNKVSQQALSSSVRAFTWKELYMATDGFKELLVKEALVKSTKER